MILKPNGDVVTNPKHTDTFTGQLVDQHGNVLATRVFDQQTMAKPGDQINFTWTITLS